jgi:threonine synthase
VDNFLQQYKYDELFSDVEKFSSNFDYKPLAAKIKDALKDIDKKSLTPLEYAKLRHEKIEELQLPINTKYNLNLFNDDSYSYKLVF